MKSLFYRVTIQVVPYLPLTCKQKLRFSIKGLYLILNRNFCFVVNRRLGLGNYLIWSPCILSETTIHDSQAVIICSNLLFNVNESCLRPENSSLICLE